ncbi:Protein of unknown function [Gryllus bimaculatus]|nr:Protein of unknown function [Gryllus bimaculatus]
MNDRFFNMETANNVPQLPVRVAAEDRLKAKDALITAALRTNTDQASDQTGEIVLCSRRHVKREAAKFSSPSLSAHSGSTVRRITPSIIVNYYKRTFSTNCQRLRC